MDHIFPESYGLYTDFYELTMAQGYFLEGMSSSPAVFDYFYRSNPFGGGYVLFAGLADLIGKIARFRFGQKDLDYLEKEGFNSRFLAMLEGFRFRGTIHSEREGEVVFPNVTVMRVDGTILEAQLIETLLLNVLNFQSLVATKASRIKQAAGDRLLMEFGLRRAQGAGGLQASRAAVVGGFDLTSNTAAGKVYGLKTSGTMAHSWVQSFDNEREAFEKYARLYPENCILLVDTYDTLNSGIPNAISVGREMEPGGSQLAGIRIDSGDLAFLSKKTREMLDNAGLKAVKIIASNQLDETIIASLLQQGAPIDAFGVGTTLSTGKPAASLDGVYKLSMVHGKPTLKVSDNPVKSTLPGKKEVFRYADRDGYFRTDAIALEGEPEFSHITDPHKPGRKIALNTMARDSLLDVVLEKGKPLQMETDPYRMAAYASQRLKKLPEEHKRFMFPQPYQTGISPGLSNLLGQSYG